MFILSLPGERFAPLLHRLLRHFQRGWQLPVPRKTDKDLAQLHGEFTRTGKFAFDFALLSSYAGLSTGYLGITLNWKPVTGLQIMIS